MQIYSDKCFEKPVRIIEAEENLQEALNEIDKLRKKYFLLGYITYDFKKLYFEVFDKYEKYTPAKSKQLGTIIRPKITKEQYINAIEKIKQYIEKWFQENTVLYRRIKSAFPKLQVFIKEIEMRKKGKEKHES